MLPFRSGRAGFSGASSAFLLLALWSCAALAGEKIARPEVEAKSKPRARPRPEEGVTNIPIAAGHDAKGLVLPDFDLNGHLRGKLEAGVTRRLDDQRVEFRGVKFTTFTPETETPYLEIFMSTSVFNLKTQVLNSSERTTVKRSDFEITGDKMQFEMLTRKGTLTGNVKMVVRGKSRVPGNEGE
jgi:Lipopolysaccharide-assembly, LptC-related